jgi:hypothetical protein
MDTRPRNPTIGEFLRVILADWGSRVSGILSVPFTALAVFVKADYAKAIWSALAVTGWIATFYQVWAKERKERIAGVPALDIVWKPGENTYRHEYFLPPPGAPLNIQFRICVVNRSETNKATNVRIRMEELSPPELPCVPCCLRLMNNILPQQEPIESFSLNPGDHQFVDLLVQTPNGKEFWILHTVIPISVVVKAQPYTFKISATAENAPSKSRRFELVKDGTLWNMEAIDD